MNPAAALTTIALGLRADTRPKEFLRTGTPIDGLTQGVPRGSISEIAGPDSSGRTALAYSILAAATTRLEICAYVDTHDSFDPCSAAASGIALERLVWVRCGGNAANAMKAADNLVHAGGFGVVALDLAQVSQRVAGRIPMSYWHRFLRVIEKTPSILLLVEREPLAKSCASLRLDMKRKKTIWTCAPGFRVLRGIDVEAVRRKPIGVHRADCALRLAV